MCKDIEHNKACNAVDMLGTCADKGGPKWITHELQYYSVRGYGHSHHPTTGWHLLRGEIFVFNYLHVLFDAYYTLENDLIESLSITIDDLNKRNFI